MALQVPSSGHLVGYPDSEVPNAVWLGNAHIARSPSGAPQYYVGFVGGTTRIWSSSS